MADNDVGECAAVAPYSAAGECTIFVGSLRSGLWSACACSFSPVVASSFLPKRQNKLPMSSISMNIAGTNTSDNTVENNRPPITASAIRERELPPAPHASPHGLQ